MDKLIMFSQFIVGLSIIVGIHELGHMLIAKFFGIRVEHYMIGFSPKIFKFKYGETEYALGALPFGGSAKISGMVDESFDEKQLESEPEPWEFRSKPGWQRLLVVLGGIIFNMCFGIFVFIAITFFYGKDYISKEQLNQKGICPTNIGKEMGLKQGDKILQLNGKKFESFEELQAPDVLLKKNSFYVVSRNGEELKIYIPQTIMKNIDGGGKLTNVLFQPLFTYKIAKVIKNGPSMSAGIKEGDVILSINDIDTRYIQTLKHAANNFKGKTVAVKYFRDNTEYTTVMKIPDNAILGLNLNPGIITMHKQYGIIQAIPVGTKKAFSVVYTNILAIKNMISGKLSVSKSLKGPIGIIQIFGTKFNWIKFWHIIAFLSMVIAFTNLLPIPALDGGHVIFIIYEMIIGRKLSTSLMMKFQIVGTVILLSILAYTLFNDILKMFK